MLDTLLFENSFTNNLLLIISMDVESFVLIVLVYSEIFDGRGDVVMPQNVGDSDKFDSCMVQCTSVCTPESMVGEMDAKTVPQNMYYGTVNAVTLLRISSHLDFLFVALIEEEVTRILP